jgi:hypothetical protein
MSTRTVQDWAEYLDGYIADMRSDLRTMPEQDLQDVLDEVRAAFAHLRVASAYIRAAILEAE